MAAKLRGLIGLLTLGLAFAALVGGALAPQSALAATLYITEFASPISQTRSETAQNLGQPALSTQTVAITGSSVQSSAFSSNTHGIQAYCDSGCSVVVGTNPTATTSAQVLTANQPQTFTVVPGQKIAVIANTSGNQGGGGTGSTVNIAASTGNGATYTHIAAGTATTVIKASAGTLYAIVMNSKATSTATMNVYDNASGSGTVIATVDGVNTVPGTTLNYGAAGINFANGLTIITATANSADMTVVWK